MFVVGSVLLVTVEVVWEGCLQNCLYCVEWDVKLPSLSLSLDSWSHQQSHSRQKLVKLYRITGDVFLRQLALASQGGIQDLVLDSMRRAYM